MTNMLDGTAARAISLLQERAEQVLNSYITITLTGLRSPFANGGTSWVSWSPFRDISAQQRVEERESHLVKERAARAEAEVARQSLLQSEQRYRALVEAAGQYVWTNSPEGRMEGEQPGWKSLTGQSTSEYEGFGWADAVHPDDAGPTVDAWNRAVAARSMFVFEHRVRRADGNYRMFSIRAVPVLNADGTIREWVGAHTDITKQRAAFAEA